MGLLERLRLDDLAPARLWTELDAPTRRQAAESLYRGPASTEAGRVHADHSIAARLRFREVAVRRLPVERRVLYLTAQVRPDDSLASSLLLALHLDRRKPLLEAFLTALGIPNEGGLIAEDRDLRPPDPERLAAATSRIYGEYPESEVDLYLASLVAMDRDVWGGLVPLLRGRAGS